MEIQFGHRRNRGNEQCEIGKFAFVYAGWEIVRVSGLSCACDLQDGLGVEGVPRKSRKAACISPTISPDGKLLAYLKTEGQGAKLKMSFVVSSLEGGPVLKEIVMPPDLQDLNGAPALRWTPDGNGLTWLSTIKNAQHVMMQPLAGGPPVQLTALRDRARTDHAVRVVEGWEKAGAHAAEIQCPRHYDVHGLSVREMVCSS